ncbi:hypothetical protein J3R83DRAFT_547 [Lanmaoa asiatica]|nr:hypothetical protein J3R83DRAFT_547 [Lanmaoa asiatica]
MIDFLTAGDKRHSSKKAERKDMRNAASMKDPSRRKRREARRQSPGVARREEEEEEKRKCGAHGVIIEWDINYCLLSSAVISAVGLTCKAFLNSGLCSITVSNLPILLDALRRERRHSGQGLITVSNHLSTSVHAPLANMLPLTSSSSLDDPITWGILPFENFRNTRTIRWVMGASDIMFTNPLFSAFFRKGQVIETFRGHGIWQPALDVAVEKLNQGHWLHMFGEGKVHQPTVYPQTDGIAHLPRFKWGVYVFASVRYLLTIMIRLNQWSDPHGDQCPTPNNTHVADWCESPTLAFSLLGSHLTYFPKMGIQLGVTFGDPIPPDEFIVALNTLRRLSRSSSSPGVVENSTRHSGPPSELGLSSAMHARGWMEGAIIQAGGDPAVEREGAGRRAQMDEIRSEVTSIIQRAVEDLGRKVSGNN